MISNDENGRLVKVTDDTFSQFIIDNRLAIVDFWAEWCHPCRILSPIIDTLSTEYRNVTFGKLNVDENRVTASTYSIMSIPTLLYFKDGEVIDETIGAIPKNTIEERIKKFST